MSRPDKNEAVEDDAALIRRLAAGDLSALEPLYERHRPMVLALVRQVDLGLGASAADDLAQEVFLALVPAARRFREGANVRSYLAGIAVRKAKEHRRVSWFRRQVLERLPFRESEAPRHEERTDAAREGERLLALLPGFLREVLVLHVVEGLGAPEIAAALEITESTVWTRLHRARTLLAELREGAP